MRLAWMIALALGACCTAVGGDERPAGRDRGQGLRRCSDITGFLFDRSAAGRAVHQRPDRGSRVLGRIAPPLRVGPREVAAGFEILASRGGWLLVEGAADDPVLTERPPRPIYGGRGWIRAEGVRVGLQASQAFARPSHASALVLSSPDGLGGLLEIAACDGRWVLGRWRLAPPARLRYERSALIAGDPATVEAWATGLCNLQETSCDGVSGDRPPPRDR